MLRLCICVCILKSLKKALLIALHRHWCKGTSLHTFIGTLVCVIVSGMVVHLFHRQWYVNELPLLYHQWYGGISLSCLQWNVGLCYRQWYGGTSLSSSVVRR